MTRTIKVPIDKDMFITVDVEYDGCSAVSKYTIPLDNMSRSKLKKLMIKLKNIYDDSNIDFISNYFKSELRLERKNKLRKLF